MEQPFQLFPKQTIGRKMPKRAQANAHSLITIFTSALLPWSSWQTTR
jgi:hypothetical protein